MPTTTHIDTTYSVATPEGIHLHLTPAGPIPRLYAWLIDTVIRFFLYILISFIANLLGNFGAGIAAIVIFFIEWFYPVFFEVLNNGQTPGKKAFNIYVALENGAPVSVGASMVRNIIRFIDFLPALYGFAFISMLLTNKFQRLGDLAANTVVLYKPTDQLIADTPSEMDELPPEPLPVALTLKEQQSIINFSTRMNTLHEERREELARLTGTLVSEQKNPARYLSALAKTLVGKS